MKLFRQRKQETLVYVVIWLIMFIYPVMSHLYTVISDPESDLRFNIDLVINSWKSLLPFFVMFLVHDLFIAPLIDRKNRRWVYGVAVAALLLSFSGYQVIRNRVNYNRFVRPAIERMNEERQRQIEFWEARANDTTRAFDFRPWMQRDTVSGESQQRDFEFRAVPPMGPGPDRGPGRGRPFNSWDYFTPIIFQLLLAFMMLAANLGVHFFFVSQENEKKLQALEKENILQQLQYLRYQINPHFFMNTLNNIHALVDIDPKQAKNCVLELSKLMRYILYEGGKPTIPLDREVDFLTQYISLMRIRFTDNVKIEVDLPENSKGSEIPPLLFVSFVENAFKHGISYKDESYIKVGMSIQEDRLLFVCENSVHETNEDPHSGIGLENVKKRLGLLYGNDFTLDIDSKKRSYGVTVSIPLSSSFAENLYTPVKNV